MKEILVKASGVYTVSVGVVAILLSIYKMMSSQAIAYEISRDKATLLAAAIYIIALGLWPIFTGIGILMRKNWARYSLFVMSIFSLFIGLSSLLPIIFLPQSLNQTHKDSSLLFELFILVVNFVFLIIIPVIFLIFFNRKKIKSLFKVKEVIARKNFRPLGVSIMAVVAFFTGISFTIFLFAPSYARAPLTFIGNLFLLGKLERIYFLVVAFLSFYIAFGLFKMKKSAWIVCIIFIFLSIIIGITNTFVIPKGAFLENLPRIHDSYAQIPQVLYSLSSFIVILVPIALLFYLFSKRRIFIEPKDKDAAIR
jgi:hypothetical protein